MRNPNVASIFPPSPQIPKLKWLKEKLPSVYAAADKFLDLADYLTYRSTSIDTRSLCTVICKWMYDFDDKGTGLGWDRSFHEAIGLSDLAEERIGKKEKMAAPGVSK